jgi:acetaldehyde dehydrogenase (acetylating)
MQQQKIPAAIVGPGNIGNDLLAKLAGEPMAHAKPEAGA